MPSLNSDHGQPDTKHRRQGKACALNAGERKRFQASVRACGAGIPLDKGMLKMGCSKSYVFLPVRDAIIKVCEHLWKKRIGELGTLVRSWGNVN